MVIVGEKDRTSRTTPTSRNLVVVDSLSLPQTLALPSHDARTRNAPLDEAPVLPRKVGSSLINSEQYCVFNTKRESSLYGREQDSHEYVNLDPKLPEHRQVFEIRRRNDSIDSSEEGYPSRSKFHGDYECMSSPESFSPSSSNRSSNTSSLAQGSSSPDSASLSSFSDRFVFGRVEGSKRCSQASTTSSQDSRSSRQSWGKTGECLDLSDGGGSSSYENITYQDKLLRKNRNMSVNIEEAPPPLPVRQPSLTVSMLKPPEVELIMPYKVVDLEELQRSLNDIEPYYVHNGSDLDDNNTYNEIIDLVENTDHNDNNKHLSIKPILPPKRRTLNCSLSDSVMSQHACNGEVTPMKPVPLPRHSVIIRDPLIKQESEEDSKCISPPMGGHLSRQQSLPVGRVIHSQRQSTSPHRTARPQRLAPPPPPSTLHNNKSSRPVSEMLPRNRSWSQFSPTALKRSNTVSMAQFPSPNTSKISDRNSVQISPIPPSTIVSPLPCQTGQTKEETGKSGSSKTFFSKSKALKKALTKAVTKKQPKKELVIGPPTDFASLYQPRVTAEHTDRERKTVSFVDREELEDESLSAELETAENDEEVYHNFPISHAHDNPEEHISPTKPPRRFTSPAVMRHDGYLQPSTSQWTKEQEEEISQNKLPELGPLPSTPASSPETDCPVILSDDDSKILTNERPPTPVVATKPKVPRRPNGLKPKLQKKPPSQVTKEKQSENSNLAMSQTDSADITKERDNTTLAGLSRRSRSYEVLNVDTSQDLTSMHLTVMKDILLRWRNMLRRPKISLSGACWEDFEVVEGGSWPKVSEDRGSVLQPVQLKKTSLNSKDCESQFIAKIKSQTHSTNSTKSCYDQDYSVCSIVEAHENVARVLAYFRGDIRPQLLGLSAQSFHTTISITDQVPAMTCDEFVMKSMTNHNNDSYERTVCLLILQCIMGLDHLHNTGYTHGNLVLSNLFLIKHADNDYQLFLGNLGKSQPLPKERRGTETSRLKSEGVTSGVRNDISAVSEVIVAMLHSSASGDQNGNHVKCRNSRLFGFLVKISARLRDGTTTLRQAVGFIQSLLWGPFKMEDRCVFSEGCVRVWLLGQRGEFIAKLAMDEALSRTIQNRTKFSMEDFLLCDYLTSANTKYLMRTGKRCFQLTYI